MSKIIKMPSTASDYIKIANRCVEKEDFIGALNALNDGYRFAKTNSQKSNILMDYANIQNVNNKLEFANLALFRILSLYPTNKEAKMLLMFNFISMNDFESAKYYYSQIGDYAEKRKIKNLTQLRSLLESQEIDDENIEQILTPFDIDIRQILAGETNKHNNFRLIDHTEEFNRIIDKIVGNIRLGNYEDALVDCDKALNCKVNKNKLALAYYSKALVLHSLKKFEEAELICVEGLKMDSKNEDMLLLLCDVYIQLGKMSELNSMLDSFFEKIDVNSFQQVRRLLQIYIKVERWEDAVKFLKLKLINNELSYILNEYLGICYFNMGLKEKARKIFIDMNNIYGTFCNAKHYLYYISTGTLDGIPADAVFGDWPVLNKIYLGYLYELVMLEKEAFGHKVVEDREMIANIFEWLSQGIRSNLVLESLELIMCLYSDSKKANKKLDMLKENIISLLTSPNCYDEILKGQIVFFMLKTQDYDKINITNNNIFYTLNIDLDYAKNNWDLTEGCYLACALAGCMGEKQFEKAQIEANKLIALAKNNIITWRSVGTIAAIVLENALEMPVETINENIKYNKSLKKKYLDQLQEINNSNKTLNIEKENNNIEE